MGLHLLGSPAQSRQDDECQETESFTARCPGRGARNPRAGWLLSRGAASFHGLPGLSTKVLVPQLVF